MWYKKLERVLTEGWPQERDLDSNQIFIEKELVDEIESHWEQQPACLIVGEEGRGKTVLARYIGYKYLKEKQCEVWHVDLGEEEGQKPDTVLYNIKDFGKKKSVLQIIENVHMHPEFWYRIEEEMSNLKARFLLTSRFRKEEFGDLKETVKLIELPSTSKRTRTFIEWYVRTHKEFADSPYVPPSINPKDWNYDMEWAYEEFSSNLRALTKCLEIWAKERPWQRLHMTNKKSFLKLIVQERFENQNLRLTLQEKSTLVKISAVYQFEVPVWIEGFDQPALDKLSKIRLVRCEGGYCYLGHTTDARHNVEGWALLSGAETSDIVFPCIQQYLIRRPPNFGRVFLHLFFQGERQLASRLAKDREIVEAAKGLMPFKDFGRTANLLHVLVWAHAALRGELYKHVVGNYDARALADTIKEGTSLHSIYWFLTDLQRSKVDGWQNFRKEFIEGINRQYLYDAVASASVSTIKSFFKRVRKFAPDLAGELRNSLSYRTWHDVHQRSSFNHPARFLAALILTKPANQIVPEEWAKARWLIEKILSSPNIDKQIAMTSVRNLGKLLRGVAQLDKHEGLKFAEELAKEIAKNVKLDSLKGKHAYDLEELSLLIHNMAKYSSLEAFMSQVIIKANLNILIEKGLKVKALNVIFWNAVKVGKGTEFISKIDEPTWLSVTEQAVATSLIDTFWLLWNLYQADQNICCAILRKIRQNLIRSLQTQQPMPAEGWALIGLLDLCNIKFSLGLDINLSELAEDLATRRDISLFAVILRHLRERSAAEANKFEQEFASKLSQKHQGLSIENLIDQFPASCSRQILRKILGVDES